MANLPWMRLIQEFRPKKAVNSAHTGYSHSRHAQHSPDTNDIGTTNM